MFDQLTAEQIIKAYRPHILAKGGDYVLSEEDRDPNDPSDTRPVVNPNEKAQVEEYDGNLILTPTGIDKHGNEYHTYPHFVDRILKKHNGGSHD